MARKGSGKGGGTNMRRATHIATSRKAKKRKAAVSRKTPQPAPAHGPSNTTPAKTPELPPFPDTSSLDAANQVVMEWHRQQRAAHHEIAATAAQQLAQSAVFAGEGSLTADATLVASEAPDTAAFTGTVAWPEYQEVLARLAELEATVAKLSPPQSIPGIGHNNPPPVDITELEEIKAEIALLKAQPPPRPVEASKAASKLLRWGAVREARGYVRQ
jgi:hypothetical protein